MTLFAGDIITTGTPPGVGVGMKPPVFLKVGDVMSLGISGLGEQRQKVVPFKLWCSFSALTDDEIKLDFWIERIQAK